MNAKTLLFTDCVDLVGTACKPFDGLKKYVSTGAVDIDQIVEADIETVDFEGKPSRANLEVEAGDVLFAKMQGTKKTLAIDSARANHIYSTGFCAVRARKKVLTERCLYHLLTSDAFLTQKDKNCSGATQKAITNAGLSKIVIKVPRIDEQESIADQLDIIGDLISKRQQVLSFLDDLIKARFVEMFGSITEERFPKCKLRDVAHIKHGYAFSGEFFSDQDNGVVLVTPGNFALGGGFQEIKNRYFTSSFPEEYVLHAGDLIVTMTDLSKKADTLGYGAIVPNTGKVYLHNQRIGLFDYLDKNLDPRFVRWYMQTEEYRMEIVRTATGSTVHHTSPDRILDSVIYLPPIVQQKKFAYFAEQVDKSKVAVQKALDEAQLLYDSLMQKYFG